MHHGNDETASDLVEVPLPVEEADERARAWLAPYLYAVSEEQAKELLLLRSRGILLRENPETADEGYHLMTAAAELLESLRRT